MIAKGNKINITHDLPAFATFSAKAPDFVRRSRTTSGEAGLRPTKPDYVWRRRGSMKAMADKAGLARPVTNRQWRFGHPRGFAVEQENI
jgi:hypothetical protein